MMAEQRPEPRPRSGPHPRAELDVHGLYQESGVTWLVCPRLIELDPRHGIRHDLWPNSWRDPSHARYLTDPEGHDSNTFGRMRGTRPHLDSEWPVCQGCGRRLVATDGDPI